MITKCDCYVHFIWESCGLANGSQLIVALLTPSPTRIAKLTLKHRETHGCVVSTVATDALVLKHQAISILSTD